MNKDNLKKVLEKKIDIIDYLDLSDLTKSPSAAYKFFKSVYQTEYSNTARIVLYSSYNPSEELIKHISKAIELNDIGCYFVLFCVPAASAKFLHNIENNNQFQHFKVQLEKTEELSDKFFLPDTVCALPWSHLEIKPDGTVTHCCNGNYVVGDITKNKLEDIFKTKLSNVRSELLTGEKPKECNGCWIRENQGVTSQRQHSSKRLINLFLGETLDDPKIKSLDIKFQNTCNFKCLICNSQFSSLHEQEQHKYLNIPIVPRSRWSESEFFLDQINDLLPSLDNIEMTGGEPFLIKSFKKILKSAVDRGLAKNIRLHYNTNGSIWPNDFVDYWKHFKEVDIHFSIDAIGKQFEYQRGGSWHEVESNILRIKNLNFDNMKISIMPAISILNVYYLDQVVNWSREHNFPLFSQYVYNPTLTLNELTSQAKDILNKKYQSTDWDEIDKILNSINSTSDSDGEKFCKHIRWYDTIRKTNFADAHFEMAHAMGYIK